MARRLGFGRAFDYRGPADVFREHAALSAFENDGRRAFDIGRLASLSDQAYDALEPVMWPARAADAPGERRFFAAGGFFTADGRARFIAPQPPSARRPQRGLPSAPQHRAFARPVAYDDADRIESAPVRAFADAAY